jgi:prolyl-tRNA synthetase
VPVTLASGLKNIWVVVDDAIPEADNWWLADAEGYHLLNVNYNRDYLTPHVAVIVAPRKATCASNGPTLRAERGIKRGITSNWATVYKKKWDYFQDEDRVTNRHHGSYGIGVGLRLSGRALSGRSRLASAHFSGLPSRCRSGLSARSVKQKPPR